MPKASPERSSPRGVLLLPLGHHGAELSLACSSGIHIASTSCNAHGGWQWVQDLWKDHGLNQEPRQRGLCRAGVPFITAPFWELRGSHDSTFPVMPPKPYFLKSLLPPSATTPRTVLSVMSAFRGHSQNVHKPEQLVICFQAQTFSLL